MHAITVAVLVVGICVHFTSDVLAEDDACEFEDVDAAQTFGWDALPGAVIQTVAPGKVGAYCLRVEPGKQPEAYMGIELTRRIDAAGAGPGDRIAFYVKQNFGKSLCVNMRTLGENRSIFRYVDVKRGEWSRVEVDLDLANWETGNLAASAWTGISYLHVYSKSFDSSGEYMLMDGFSVTAGGKPVSLPLVSQPGEKAVWNLEDWTFPHQTGEAWYLGGPQAAWAVSKTTGQVLGGWNAKTKERCLNSLEGRYHLEDRQSLVTGRESADTVLRAEFSEKEQRVELTCSNPDVPDLVIRKQYWPDGNKLFQRVAFTTRSRDLQFITFNTETAFTRAYRKGSYYMGGADGGGPLIPAPKLSVWQKVVGFQNTAKGMLLHQPIRGYSFAHMRTHLDDTFVWPYFTGAVASYCEPVNVLHYTPDGWDMSLGTSKLSTDKETSYTQYVTVFDGDWQTFLRSEYPALPDVQQALAEIPPVPDWVNDVKLYAGGDLQRIRNIVEATEEGTIMVLVTGFGGWSDYYVDQGMPGKFGGLITGPELKDYIGRIKALSPRIKVGIYMWALSTFDTTRIYKEHPEWFRYGNKDGEVLNTFPGFWTNLAHLLSIPECYDEILSQFDRVLGYLETDYIYLDDPKAINPVDWASGEYTRDDQSFRFFLDIKRIAAKHGPDKVVFFNNQCNPYGDINFIEARAHLRENFWRNFSGISAINQEFIGATRPDARIVPLYYIPPFRREYMNRVLALGWIPSLTYCDPIESRPFFQAAFELGNCRSLPARYSPDWKSDPKTQVESYAVRRYGDHGALVSFINHARTPETVPVQIDLDSLDLDRDGRVFVWEYRIEDGETYTGELTESMARHVYADTGWHLDRVTRRKLVYEGPYRPRLDFRIETEPLILHQFYITTEPAAVYSENNMPANYLFDRMPRVDVRVRADWEERSLEIAIDSERDRAEIMALLPLSAYRITRFLLNGKSVRPDWASEGDDVFPLVTVDKGRHRLDLEFDVATGPAGVDTSKFQVDVAPGGAMVTLPGFDRALVTVEREGRALFNRFISGERGRLPLPIVPPRQKPGDYDVTCSLRAVVDNEGRILPVKEARASLTLSEVAEPLVQPTRPPPVPEEREVTAVNRTINGVEILQSAKVTSSPLRSEIQPELESLMAAVNPDDLVLEAGTTRKVIQFCHLPPRYDLGAAFAGFEIRDLRKVKVRLENTFCDAFHARGRGFHLPPKPNSRNFAGIVIDYHTPQGYTKRVGLATGILHPECSSTHPDYGTATVADEFRDLGTALIEEPEAVFSIDLQEYAPVGWDGQVWLSVGTDWVTGDRRLKLQILGVNDAVTDEAATGTDPREFQEAYAKPRVIEVSRSPGGILVDGPSGEEWWRGAALADQFYLLGAPGISEARTTAKLLYDDDNLYVAFICDEPARKKPLILGAAPWSDDSVEVWVDVNRDRKTFRQVIVNAANNKVEYGEAGPTPIGATSAVYVDTGKRWMVEVVIPFKGLGVEPPKPGDEWRLSLCRYRPAGTGFNTQMIVWAPLKAKGFHDLANFGTMIFK